MITYHSPCARSLLDILCRSLQARRAPPDAILLFALAPSPSTPPGILSQLASTLTRFHPKHVGCISAPLPYQYLGPRMRSEPHSCSLAYAFVRGLSFRSTILGRAEVHVGRWHAARKRNTGDASMPEDRCLPTEATSFSSTHGLGSDTLPDGLRNVDPSTISNFFCFSDMAPEGLATTLHSAFPRTNMLSLIASSTPFITGRPVTLFYNGSVLSNGAVGVAFTSTHFSPPPTVELSLPPLVTLSRNLNVTSSDGNVILSLESGNPTQLLLSAIQKHGLSSSNTTWVDKEDEFYVGVIDPSDQQVSQLHRITAGSPSRGGIVLNAVSAPREGSIVRLYHLPKDAVPDALPCATAAIPNSISLFVTPEVVPVTGQECEVGDNLAAGSDHFVTSDAFLAASENGFAVSRGTQGPWKCVVPGSRVRLSL